MINEEPWNATRKFYSDIDLSFPKPRPRDLTYHNYAAYFFLFTIQCHNSSQWFVSRFTTSGVALAINEKLITDFEASAQ